MKFIVERFARDESGAVTVDWVVLTAAIALIGAGIVAIMSDETTQLGADTGAALAKIEMPTLDPL
ncbi:hypothetical protein FHG71_12405 [Rubellimicrobium roseum]|uniref:Pilus assembly protein n=2 Tax=Rubellimicrobium roseum TaxID=687525 RepID=A0A5C4NBN2_9RHOB|nr:hypothetical protein FHG71_12405 [Rubellimicrobium roseum]